MREHSIDELNKNQQPILVCGEDDGAVSEADNL